jgi:6-phosphogluconolactonase
MTSTTEFIGFVGTYTKGESKGIYSFKFDTQKATISEIKLAAELENPSYLNISEDNRYLYSVVKESENGGVAAFRLNSQSGELQPLNIQLAAGSPPCHVSIDSKNRFLFSANYHKGTVESYLINQEDGSINPPVSIVQHQGAGPDPRQEKPHTHFAQLTPDERFLAVVELGIDQLLTYKVSEYGELVNVNQLAIPPGSGPRHLAFHPNHKFAYIMTEFSSEVIVLLYNAEDGSFVEVQTITTLPEHYKDNNQGSAIHISTDGKFLYAGNRGHNSIAVFHVNGETGKLTWLENVSTEGDWPRDFVLDPTEKFILVTNQNSSNLVIFARDTETGKLTLIQSDNTVPDPVCVKFIR